jgi:hypothetical protein
VPAVISNALCRDLKIGAAFLQIEDTHPNWADEVRGSLDNADHFVAVIESIKSDLLAKKEPKATAEN